MSANVTDIHISPKAGFRSEFDREIERIEREQPCVNTRYGALQTLYRFALAERDLARSQITPKNQMAYQIQPEGDIDLIFKLANVCADSVVMLETRLTDDCSEIESVKRAAVKLQESLDDHYDGICEFEADHSYFPSVGAK